LVLLFLLLVVAYVCDDVNLECERKHVGVQTGLGELSSLGRALGLLEDGLERLQGVLDLDDRGVVDGVSHCGGERDFVVEGWVEREERDVDVLRHRGKGLRYLYVECHLHPHGGMR
jgi:hypothetical protein